MPPSENPLFVLITSRLAVPQIPRNKSTIRPTYVVSRIKVY